MLNKSKKFKFLFWSQEFNFLVRSPDPESQDPIGPGTRNPGTLNPRTLGPRTLGPGTQGPGVLYSIVQYCTVLYSAVQYCIVLYSTVLLYCIRYSNWKKIKNSRAPRRKDFISYGNRPRAGRANLYLFWKSREHFLQNCIYNNLYRVLYNFNIKSNPVIKLHLFSPK